MPTVTMPLPRMNTPAIPATVTFNFREMPALDGPGIGEVPADSEIETDSGEWSLWQNLDGTFVSSPTVAAWGDSQIDLFAISTDSQMYHKRWGGSTWTPWQSLEGTCIYAPASVARGANIVDVFAIGLDKGVYRKWWDGVAWQGWEPLGGTCIHGLAATSWGPDRIDLFTVGTNSCIYHNFWDGANWRGWQPFLLNNQMAWERSSTTIATPAAVASAPGHIDLFVLGIDNHVYHAWGEGENWQGWENLGGPGMHGLAVAAPTTQRLDLFTIGTDIQGTDNHMYHRARVDGRWGSWENLGGACISAPAAVALGANHLEAFVVGTRSALFQKSWKAGGGEDGLGAQSFDQVAKDAAKAKLDAIHSPRFPPYKARALAVIDNPASLNQGSYGVCGMATAVYFFLQYDLDKYVALVKSIFDGDAFNGIPVGMKVLNGRPSDYSVLLYGRERQLQNKPKGPTYTHGVEFDFIVSRSLGKLLKIRQPTTYDFLTRFSEQFDPLFNYKGTVTKITLFQIDFANMGVLDQTTSLLSLGTPSEELKQKLRENEVYVVARLGNGIDLNYPSVKNSAANEWDLVYGWPVPGAKVTLRLERDGSTLKVSSDRNPFFNGQLDLGTGITNMVNRLDQERFIGGDLNLLERFKQFNYDELCKNLLGFDLGSVVVRRITQGKVWVLDCNLIDKKLLTLTRNGTALTVSIDLNKAEHPLTSEGDLAFDLDGLVTLMRDVVGGSEVDFTYSLFNTSMAKINTTFEQQAKPFVLATINGYTEWCMAKYEPTRRTFDIPPVPEAPVWGEDRRQFSHIIGVTGAIKEVGAYYEVPVWTWATEFTVKIKKNLLSKYIQGYVFGSL